METTFDQGDDSPKDPRMDYLFELLKAAAADSEAEGLLGGAETPFPFEYPTKEEILAPWEPVNATPVDARGVRTRTLEVADELVNGDRNVQYGDPRADFARTAELFTTYFKGIIEREQGQIIIRPHDVAVFMVLLKVSRLAWTPGKADSWVDIAGYAACGADCAEATYGLTGWPK